MEPTSSEGEDIQYSDGHSTDTENDLFSAHSSDNDFVDDSLSIVDNEHCRVILKTMCDDLEEALNSDPCIHEGNYIADVMKTFDANKLDIELNSLKRNVDILDISERLLCLYFLAIDYDRLDIRVCLENEADELIADLRRIEVPTQTSGFFKIIESRYTGFDNIHSEAFKTLLNVISAQMSAKRPKQITVYKECAKQAFTYFFEDVNATDSTNLLTRRLTQMMDLFNIDQQMLNDLRLSGPKDDKCVLARPQVCIKREATHSEPVSTVDTLEELLKHSSEIALYDSDEDTPVQIQRRTQIKKSSVDISQTDVGAWKGELLENEAIEAYKAIKFDKEKYKSLIAGLYKRTFINLDDAANVLCSATDFYTITRQLSKSLRIDINAARKWSNDIVCSNKRSALTYIYKQHQEIIVTNDNPELQPSQNHISQSQSQVSLQFANIAKCHPTEEECKIVLRTSMSDERFACLPSDWKYKEASLPAGIFKEFVSLNERTKHAFLLILGEDSGSTFVENISDFCSFNADQSRVSKNGIWATESCQKTVNNLPLNSVTYVLLTMSRKASVLSVIQEIVWFLKIKNINLADCLFEVFNTIADFKDCYTAMNSIKLESEGGFIGAIDTELRNRLKLNDADQEHEAGFRFITQYLSDHNILTVHAAMSFMEQALDNQYSTDADGVKFRECVKATMHTANHAISTAKGAVHWNNELKKIVSPFVSTNLGLITSKIANDLFIKIDNLNEYYLNPSVDITDWDEDEMGPLIYKGSLLQPAILNLVQSLRTQHTSLLYVLKVNKINPAAFFNALCNHTVKAGRRDRTILLTGPKQSGKSIVANAILHTFDGKRLAADMTNGRDFNVAATADECIGVTVLEDVAFKTLKEFVDKNCRPLLDGDECVLNPKMKGTSKGTWRSCLITTNVDNDSDSDDASLPPQKLSLKNSNILHKRKHVIQFRQDLSQAKPSLYIEQLPQHDILLLFWRYGLFPQCNTLFNGPRCEYSPCKSASIFGEHHFHCPLVRETLTNVEHGIAFDSKVRGNIIDEQFERVNKDNIGLIFDIDKSFELRNCMEHIYQCSVFHLSKCKSLELQKQKTATADKIKHFIEYVWIPLCFVSSYMRGQYSVVKKHKWCAKHVLKHHLFDPTSLNNDQDIVTMNDMLGLPDIVDNNIELLNRIKLSWCHSKHTRVQMWTSCLLHNEELNWKHLFAQDVKCLLKNLKQYVQNSANKKRFHRVADINRVLCDKLATGDIDDIFSYVIGLQGFQKKTKSLRVKTVEDIDARFFD